MKTVNYWSGRGYQNVKLQVDHIHGSTTFRGWLCTDCNSGMGKLGDNLEGVLQAAIYLENDTDKIIGTLHKVFNESEHKYYT